MGIPLGRWVLVKPECWRVMVASLGLVERTSARVVIAAARRSDGSDLAAAAKKEAGCPLACAHDALTITAVVRGERGAVTVWTDPSTRPGPTSGVRVRAGRAPR